MNRSAGKDGQFQRLKIPLFAASGGNDGKGPDATSHQHNTADADYLAHVEEKFYEYAAMAEMLAILAGARGREAQIDAYTKLKLGLKAEAENGWFVNLLRFSVNDKVSGDLMMAGAANRLMGDKKTADDLDAESLKYREQATAAAKEVAKPFEAAWDEFKKRWAQHGFVYAVSIFATDFVIDNAAGLAIGGVAGVAAKGVLKGLTFAGRRAGGKIAGLVTRRGIVAMAGEKAAQAEFERSFAQAELEKVYGTPKENHAGVRSEDPNREVGAATKKKLISTAEVGRKAEEQAIKDLKADGYDKIYTIQNASGNGVDAVAVNSETRAVKGLEVKGNSAGLSDAQADMGGEAYVRSQLEAQRDGTGRYSGLSKADKDAAGQALKDIRGASSKSYEVWKYDVDRETGAVGNRRSANWGYPPGKKPARLVFRNDEGKARHPRPKPKPPSTGPPGQGDR